MAMYFVQHGLSVAKEVNPDRPLSDEGRLEVERVAIHLHRMGVTVGHIFHSGKTRARQTAELFAEHLVYDRISPLPGMAPNDSAAVFAEGVEDNAMYVGHLPHMGELVSLLVGDDERADVVRFTNGGVVCVERSEPGCYMKWFLTPVMCLIEG